MKFYWLTQKNNKSCILFLAGWGMDQTPFRSFPAGNHDVLLVYDYCQVTLPEVMQQLNGYPSLHLVAWSMGVWVAGTYFSDHEAHFTSATALNGTLNPIDDKLGIPVKPFDDMIENFSEQILAGFYRDMFDGPEQEQLFLKLRPTRSLKSIAAELQSLKKQYAQHGPGKDIFTRKIVGSRDRIFPARAQLRSWGKENCLRIKQAHFPFYDLPSWDTIIAGGLQE